MIACCHMTKHIIRLNEPQLDNILKRNAFFYFM